MVCAGVPLMPSALRASPWETLHVWTTEVLYTQVQNLHISAAAALVDVNATLYVFPPLVLFTLL